MRMNDSQKKAWALLKPDEQTSISLKHGMGKSTWAAGEIMNKAHYKFLEIKARAEKFLRMFTEHFEVYDEVIPSFIRIPDNLRAYFKLLIAKRLEIKEALEIIDDDDFNNRAHREEAIINYLKELSVSNDEHEKALFDLIMEFDRWNNFRILPVDIQEPSAFKRRNKNRERKRIQSLLMIDLTTIKIIEKAYGWKKKGIIPSGYVVLFKDIFSAKIQPVVVNDDSIAKISEVFIYIFKTKELAEAYKELLQKFFSKHKKSCRDGQSFWPTYRSIIQRAANYEQVQRINPTRKQLELANQSFL